MDFVRVGVWGDDGEVEECVGAERRGGEGVGGFFGGGGGRGEEGEGGGVEGLEVEFFGGFVLVGHFGGWVVVGLAGCFSGG